MKVYIITNECFPYGRAATNRIICYAKSVLYSGFDCEVVVYRRTEIFGHKTSNTMADGVFEGVTFKYIGGCTTRSGNVVIRKVDDILDKIRLFIFLNRNLNDGDVILSYSYLDTLFKIHLCNIAHYNNAKIALDLGEYPYCSENNAFRRRVGRFFYTKYVFSKIDGLIPISNALADFASSYVSKKCIVCKLPIFIDFEKYNLNDSSSSADVPFIFHSGTLSDQKDGVVGMFAAFGELHRRYNIDLKFISTGSPETVHDGHKIRTIIEKYKLEDKIIFVGDLELDQLRYYLSRAMMVLSYRYDNLQIRYGFSTKLGEYMAAGKPIIATRVGEPVNWLQNGRDCLFIEPGDEDALIEKIRSLFYDRKMRIELGMAAKETCKNSFDFRVISPKLRAFLLSL